MRQSRSYQCEQAYSTFHHSGIRWGTDRTPESTRLHKALTRRRGPMASHLARRAISVVKACSMRQLRFVRTRAICAEPLVCARVQRSLGTVLALACAFVRRSEDSKIALRIARTRLTGCLGRLLLIEIAEVIAVDAAELTGITLEQSCRGKTAKLQHMARSTTRQRTQMPYLWQIISMIVRH
jgi:hypothetical protein